MEIARKALAGLGWTFVLSVMIQFFLAGLGVLGGKSIEPHQAWGSTMLLLLPFLMFLVACIGRMGGLYIGLTLVLFFLVGLQAFLASPDLTPMWLRSFHVLDAAIILGLGHHLAQQASWKVRGKI